MSNPIQIPESAATSPLSPALRNTLYSALLTSSGIPAIQATLTHELQASGWTTNLRAYITALLRSGECTSFNEVMDRVLAETQLGPSPPAADKKETNGTVVNGVNGNGHKTNGTGVGVAAMEGKTVEDGGVQIPERAIREGVRAVRRELEAVCEITVEEED